MTVSLCKERQSIGFCFFPTHVLSRPENLLYYLSCKTIHDFCSKYIITICAGAIFFTTLSNTTWPEYKMYGKEKQTKLINWTKLPTIFHTNLVVPNGKKSQCHNATDCSFPLFLSFYELKGH